jgi:hypothetical protein
MTSRFRGPFRWFDLLLGIALGMMLFGYIKSSHAMHSWHTWVLDHYEWVYDANDRRVKHCIYRCTTDVNNPHYEKSLGNEHGCIVP